MNNTYDNDNSVPAEPDFGLLYKAVGSDFGQDAATEVIKQLNSIEFEGKTPDVLVAKALWDMNHYYRGKAQALAAQLRKDRNNRALKAEFQRMYSIWWVCMKQTHKLYQPALAKAKYPKHPPQHLAAS